MTIAVEDTKVAHACDGATTEFDITFKSFITDDIKVVHIDSDGVETVLTETDDYSISGNLDTGGMVTTVATYAAGVTLLITLDIELSQETDIPYGSSYKSEDIETMSDKLTKICQQLSEKIGRALLFKVSSDETDIAFPELTASAMVKVNAAGDGLEMGPTFPTIDTENSLLLVNSDTDGFDQGPTLADLGNNKYLRTNNTGSGITMGHTVGTIEAYHAGALAAQEAAEVAQTAAELAETNAELAETNAEAAQALSEAAQALSEAAQILAAASATAASDSEDAAALSELATAADAVATALDVVSTAADVVAAAASALAASNSETAAGLSETAAGLSETAAGVSESNAADSETAAGLSEVAAAASAAGVNLPAIEAGDTDKILMVNAAEDGYDLNAAVAVKTFLDIQDTDVEIYGTTNTLRDGFDAGFRNGFFSGCTLSDAGGLNVSWDAGIAFVDGVLKAITLNASFALTDNATNYVYASKNDATLNKSTSYPSGEFALRAIVWTYGADIHHIFLFPNMADGLREGMWNFARNILPAAVSSGCAISIDANATNANDFTISTGLYYLEAFDEVTVEHIIYSAGAGHADDNVEVYFHIAAAWSSDLENGVNFAQWDNGTQKTNVANAKWYCGFIFLEDADTPIYVYPQTQHISESLAIEEALTYPPYHEGFVLPIARFIFRGGAEAFGANAYFVDIRPFFGSGPLLQTDGWHPVSYVKTMVGNETPGYAQGYCTINHLDPGGADRTFNPTASYPAGYEMVIINTGEEFVTFDSGTLGQTVGPGQKISFYFDGTSWF